jgi:hypothetical protein
MHLTREYFVPAPHLVAKSHVDYLVSPLEQIRDRLNEWFVSVGSQPQVHCDDGPWVVASSAGIPAEVFDLYESFFRVVHLYRTRVGTRNEGESKAPSDQQISAAVLGLANLMAALVPAPSPMLLEDGTIGGYWRRGRRYVSIDFEVDGENTWAGTDGVEFHSGTWQLPSNPLPPSLTTELLAISV